MPTKEVIIGKLRQMLPHLAEAYGVSKIALFGSFAAGTARSDSDIDLLVELNRPLGFGFMDLADELEEKLGRKVDLLTRDGLADIRIPHIKNNISETLHYVRPA